MTEDGNIRVCDACAVDERMASPAMISVSQWPGDGWVAQKWQSGPDMHFCPEHAAFEKRERLAEGFYLECARCGRTSNEAGVPTRWVAVPAGDHVCGDCFDPETDRHSQ